MRTIQTRLLFVLALAFVAFAGNAVAQTQASPILNTLEVQKLAASAEPADNARLAAHFSALAARYTAEAKQHSSMAASFGSNRTIGPGMSVHCKRIAELNTQSATTLRELATHHNKVAAGVASTPPAGAAAFQGGTDAREPTEKELTALAAKARSVADHRALQEYFTTKARRYTAEANQHDAFAKAYHGTRMTWAPGMHDHLARLARESAKEATASATMHQDLAGVAR